MEPSRRHEPAPEAPDQQADPADEQAPRVQSSIAAREAAADPDADEISGDTPDSRMPQL
jgi:hypothetical protein